MKVTKLFGCDYVPTEENYAQAVWLLKKYTSFSYIERCYQMLATFTREYNAFAASGNGCWPNAGYRASLIQLYDFQAGFERGLSLLRIGDAAAYDAIGPAADF